MPSVASVGRPEDTILEDLVNRGIGVSGLTQRAIQQSNLPDLSSAVAQSQATLQNLADQRKSNLFKSISGRIPGVNKSGLSAGSPTGVITFGENAIPQGLNANPNVTNTQARAFGLTLPGTQGRHTDVYQFGGLDELHNFIKGNPALKDLQYVMPGANVGLTPQELEKLTQIGVTRTSDQAARKVSGIYPAEMPGIGTTVATDPTFKRPKPSLNGLLSMMKGLSI